MAFKYYTNEFIYFCLLEFPMGIHQVVNYGVFAHYQYNYICLDQYHEY